MTNNTNKIEQLFENPNKKIEQTIQDNLLRKNKLKVRVRSLSKTTVITLVSLIGAVVFSVSFAWFLASY